MRHLTLAEVLELHRRIIASSGGSALVRDLNALQSAVAQPRMTFGGQDLYSSLTDKAAALCFSIVANHPFVDGNKRTAHAALETMLVLNGFELHAQVDEQEKLFLSLAAGTVRRDQFAAWVAARTHSTKNRR